MPELDYQPDIEKGVNSRKLAVKIGAVYGTALLVSGLAAMYAPTNEAATAIALLSFGLPTLVMAVSRWNEQRAADSGGETFLQRQANKKMAEQIAKMEERHRERQIKVDDDPLSRIFP